MKYLELFEINENILKLDKEKTITNCDLYIIL